MTIKMQFKWVMLITYVHCVKIYRSDGMVFMNSFKFVDVEVKMKI